MGRKIILNLAMSLDGYIADKENRFDWIEGDGRGALNTKVLFDFPGFLRGVDVIVMGRKAYDHCGTAGLESGGPKRFIVAASEKRKNLPGVEFVSEEITAFIQQIQNTPGKDIWLFGGGGLTDVFIKKDLIDEYIIGIVPILLGEGVPLFRENNPRIKMKMTEFTVQEGLAVFRYEKR